MAYIDNFNRQHREVLALLDKIKPLLNPGFLKRDTTEVVSKLSTLTGKLSVHLAMEDKSLYPRLAETGTTQTKAIAAKFMNEMGNLFADFTEYSKAWLKPNSIKANPIQFINDSNKVLQALQRRIEREERELYPLLEEVN